MSQVPDYYDFIKEPMDLSTMRQKAETHKYHDMEEFEHDFNTMINNCMAYNAKDTMFYRAAVRLRDQVSAMHFQPFGYFKSVLSKFHATGFV